MVPPRNERVDKVLGALSRPSLGQWVGMLRELTQHYQKAQGHPMAALWSRLNGKQREADSPALLKLYNRICNGPDQPAATHSTCRLLDLFDRIVTYRNAVGGHGGPRTNDFYEQEMGPRGVSGGQ